MLTIRKSEERGHANHGWLDTYHTFSFANYYDPDFVQFGPLRVINQDRVEPGRGFGTHGHRDMEIISYVLEGSLEHKDSMGNGSAIGPGDVQVMSAGLGITHSEFNGSATDPLHFLQMWIMPRENGTEPRYEEKHFPLSDRQNQFRLLVSPDGDRESLTINQDAWFYAARAQAGSEFEHTVPAGHKAWVHVAQGEIKLNGETLASGDGAAIESEESLKIESLQESEVILWEVLA